MVGNLQIQLLGGFHLVHGDAPLTTITSSRLQSLLAYLVLHAEVPQSRLHLSSLFWPDSTESQARTNLRKALLHLRRALPEADQLLETSRQTVQWRPTIHSAVDVQAFESAWGRAEQALQAGEGTVPRAALERAIRLYSGDLLPGHYDDWVLAYRERLRQRFLEALNQLCHVLEELGDLKAALHYGEVLVREDSLHEGAYRRLMRLYARDGDLVAALNTYRLCVATLERELGVEPSPATHQAYEKVLVLGSSPPQDVLPPQPSAFIGRTEELKRLVAMLRDEGQRLISLTGPGGIGKTSLAVQAALHLRARHPTGFPQGIYFASLEPVDASRPQALLLAEALGFSFVGERDPLQQLCDHLRERETLLILDNYEPDSDQGDFLGEIIRNTRGPRLLVTSRQRLRLRGEQTLQLQGLSYPDDPEGPLPENPEQLYDAVALFVERARRVRPGFEMTKADGPWVAHICQMVAGHPLGVEIAAAWTRALTCEEIAQEMGHDLDFLTSALHDRPERQRSLRAILDRAWEQLNTGQQATLSRMAVFQRGFTREAAREVVGATVYDLAGLVDQSLLRWDPSGRYGFHALLHSYASEKLAAYPERRRRVSQAHARYYSGLLKSCAGDLRGPGQRRALRAIAADLENIRTAWNWALAGHQEGDLERMTPGLYAFFELQSWFADGLELFSRAAHEVRKPNGKEEPEQDPSRLVFWKLQSRAAALAHRLGRYDEAREQLARCLDVFEGMGQAADAAFARYFLGSSALRRGRYQEAEDHLRACEAACRRLGDEVGTADALNSLGDVLRLRGEYPRAIDYLSESLAYRRKMNDPSSLALSLNNLGMVFNVMGRYQEAGEHLAEGLAIYREIGDRWGEARVLNNLGQMAKRMGDHTTALQRYQESLEIRREIGNPFGVALVLNNLGDLQVEIGRYAEARGSLWESLLLHQKIDDRRGTALALFNLGKLAARMDDPDEAKRRFLQALEVALEIKGHPMALDALVALAEVLHGEGREEALAVFALAAEHPAAAENTRQVARQYWESSQADVAPGVRQHAQDLARDLGLEELANQTLALLKNG